jgi:hypothetical protein
MLKIPKFAHISMNHFFTITLTVCVNSKMVTVRQMISMEYLLEAPHEKGQFCMVSNLSCDWKWSTVLNCISGFQVSGSENACNVPAV